MSKIIVCDCKHKINTDKVKINKIITGKGAVKAYLECPSCKKSLILYETETGWYRSKSREDYESGKVLSPVGGPLTDIITELRRRGFFKKEGSLQ